MEDTVALICGVGAWEGDVIVFVSELRLTCRYLVSSSLLILLSYIIIVQKYYRC